METKLKVIEIIKELNDDFDPETDKNIIEDGILDSFDIVSFVIELNTAFGIEIGVDNILPENFENVESIVAMIERLKK